MSYKAPYSVQLDPDSARNLAAHGASILLLDVPLGAPIGMDQQVSDEHHRAVQITGLVTACFGNTKFYLHAADPYQRAQVRA